jgi:hypothetical protein
MSVLEQFPDSRAEARESAERANLVRFVGDGTTLLKTPGCTSVRKVFVDHIEIPEILVNTINLDGAGNLGTEEIRMWKLTTDVDGGAALQRSVVSNDGIWQLGQNVFIDGDFEEPKKAKAAKTEPAKTEE